MFGTESRERFTALVGLGCVLARDSQAKSVSLKQPDVCGWCGRTAGKSKGFEVIGSVKRCGCHSSCRIKKAYD